LASLIPLDSLVGEKNVPFSALLVLACATAVTSIPVISRIFHDLGIMKTRFASLILGTAVLEDIALWGVLAIATSYATSATIDGGTAGTTVEHIMFNAAYLILALAVLPRILSKLRAMKWNFLYKKSPLAHVVVVLSLYIALAAFMHTNLVFAAFLAGFGIVGGIKGRERKYFRDSLSTISKFSFSVFIPVYFAMVGYRLVFDGTFSIGLLFIFLFGSSLLSLLSVGLAARMAGFKKLDIINLAITTNARGGPGIVLASVAFEAGIISSAFYTTLVLTALITSQIAGTWLRFVLHKGWALLSDNSTPVRAAS
jgi:Kef-type K+ transport system membrane component KefB